MRQHRRTTDRTPSRHARLAAAAAAHAPRRGGYTQAEHDRAIERLLADLAALDTPRRDAELHEPKLRLTAPLRAHDLVRHTAEPAAPAAHHA